jgi:hypothetical protein
MIWRRPAWQLVAGLAMLMSRPAFAAPKNTQPPSKVPLSTMTSVGAEPAVVQQRLFLGIGVIGHRLGQYATDDSGKSSKGFQSILPELSIQGRFSPGWDHWQVSPRLGFTPFARWSPDDHVASRVGHLSGVVSYDTGFADFGLGAGLLFWLLSGKGGTVELKNGNGTAQFGVPGDTTAIFQAYPELSAGVHWRRFRWDNSILITDALSSRRAVSFISLLAVGVL